MPSVGTISADKLARLIGTPKCPTIIDVRIDEDISAHPLTIPGTTRRPFASASAWAAQFSGQSVVVVCHRGMKLSHGAAAWLRDAGADAVVLEGGIAGWKEALLPLVPLDKLPPRNAEGRTVWVTRSRPKIDRIACPWLIRRFVDPKAAFLFVAP